MKNNLSKQQFIEAFEMYHTFVYRYIYLKLNNTHTSEDLTQEVFYKLWKTRNSFDPNKAHLKTWIARITHNLLVDFYRSNENKSTLDIDNLNEVLVSQNNIDDIELKIELIKSLKLLSNDEQQLIILKYIEGFEAEEIAQIINKNFNTTRTLIYRAINKLKEIINGKNK